MVIYTMTFEDEYNDIITKRKPGIGEVEQLFRQYQKHIEIYQKYNKIYSTFPKVSVTDSTSMKRR